MERMRTTDKALRGDRELNDSVGREGEEGTSRQKGVGGLSTTEQLEQNWRGRRLKGGAVDGEFEGAELYNVSVLFTI